MCGVAPGSRQGSSGGSGNNANLQAVACGRQLYCTRLTCFTLNLSLAAFCSHTVGPYLVSQVSLFRWKLTAIDFTQLQRPHNAGLTSKALA